MAGFCHKCSIEFFNEDFEDFKGIISVNEYQDGIKAEVICEGCGRWIYVDHLGNKIGDADDIYID